MVHKYNQLYEYFIIDSVQFWCDLKDMCTIIVSDTWTLENDELRLFISVWLSRYLSWLRMVWSMS